MPLGSSPLNASRLAYGCWRIAEAEAAAGGPRKGRGAGHQALIAAYEAGFTLFDGADVYGGGRAEEILGETLQAVPGMRERVLITSKCGVQRAGTPRPESPKHWNWTREHIVESCESSLRKLGIEAIDLYMLHRPDYLGEPQEVSEALLRLRDAGKLRYLGLSNARPSLLQMLQSFMPLPLLVNQVEISLVQNAALEDGTLDQCLEKSITPMAWSPLAGGLLGEGAGRTSPSVPAARVADIWQTLDTIASARGVTRTAVAYAWLLRHPAGILPIVGSTHPQRIRESVAATGFNMTREEWYGLLEAARGAPIP